MVLELEVLDFFCFFFLLFWDFLNWPIATAALGCIALASEQMLKILLHRVL